MDIRQPSTPDSDVEKGERESRGIPMAGPGRDSLADTAVGRTLLGLLKLSAEREFRRADVMGWLTGCPISPPTGQDSGLQPQPLGLDYPQGGNRRRPGTVERAAGRLCQQADQRRHGAVRGGGHQRSPRRRNASRGHSRPQRTDFHRKDVRRLETARGRQFVGAFLPVGRGTAEHLSVKGHS